MRIDTLRGRVAGKSATGTLTSPNVIVPDQNVRMPVPGLSSSSSSAMRGLPFADSGEARLERVGEFLVAGLPRAERFDFHFAALCLRLDELHHALPVLVAELRGVELSLESLEKLPGHLQFFFVERAPFGSLQIFRRDDFPGMPEHVEYEVAVLDPQRAYILPVAHHPLRDALFLF